MAVQDGFGNLYKQICQEWNKAEQDVKRAEQVCDEVIIPSIMELRYAGRRVVQALELISQDGDKEEAKKLLHDAWFNCHRARHDAIDASTTQMAKVIKIAVKKLRYSAILQAFPQFSQLWYKLQTTRRKIVESRGSSRQRDEIYEIVEDTNFPEVLALFEEFQHSEPVMRAIAERDRRLSAVAWVALSVAVIAVLGEAFNARHEIARFVMNLRY